MIPHSCRLWLSRCPLEVHSDHPMFMPCPGVQMPSWGPFWSSHVYVLSWCPDALLRSSFMPSSDVIVFRWLLFCWSLNKVLYLTCWKWHKTMNWNDFISASKYMLDVHCSADFWKMNISNISSHTVDVKSTSCQYPV